MKKQNKDRKVFLSVFEIIAFFADITALGQLAFDVITNNNIQFGNFIFRIFIVAFALLIAFGADRERRKGEDDDKGNRILDIYIWIYLITASISYLAIIFKTSSNYSIGQFFSIILILGIQIMAFTILMKINQTDNTSQFAYLMMTISLIHLIKFIVIFLFRTGTLVLVLDIILEVVIWVTWFFYSYYLLYIDKPRRTSKGDFFRREGKKE